MPDQNEALSARLQLIRQRIAACALRNHRAPEAITLIAVSKTHPPETVQQAMNAGASDFGENRVQEADGKIAQLGNGGARPRWHLIGHLQANKARRAVTLFDVIHSLDSKALAERLERLCVEEKREHLPVLIQIDLGDEETKSGASEAELPELVQTVSACEHLQLIGLMTLPPFFENAEKARPYFRRLRELRDALHRHGHFGGSAGELSMGMSHDFEIAVEEGATMVRVGTAIFGTRGQQPKSA